MMSHKAFQLSSSAIFSTLLSSAALFTLSACEIAGQKRPKPAESTKVILPYVLSVQYAINAEANFSGYFSFLAGQPFVADAGSNFDNVTSPQIGECKFASEEGLNLINPRPLNIGDLKLTNDQVGSITLTKAEKTFGWGAGGALPNDNEYEIETTGTPQGQLSFRQKFKVLAPGSGITLQSGIKGNVIQLSTPDKVDPTTGNPIVVSLDKMNTAILGYTAPAGTDYVKATFWNDQDAGPENRVVCYGSPEGPIEVPPESFKAFKTTADGLLEIDFVSVSHRTDITKVKESLILSITRQIHGRKDVTLSGVREPVSFGTLIYQ